MITKGESDKKEKKKKKIKESWTFCDRKKRGKRKNYKGLGKQEK